MGKVSPVGWVLPPQPIGGYQVCEKWLKDRKGCVLSKVDIEHYYQIVVALYETTRLMKEPEKLIDQHGGWPGGIFGRQGKRQRREDDLEKYARNVKRGRRPCKPIPGT